MSLVRWHGQWAKDAKRCWIYFPFGFVGKASIGRVPRSRWLTVHWGEMYTEGIQLSLGFGYGFWLTLEPPYKLRHRIPGWPRDIDRSAGLNWFAGSLHLELGYNSWGSHYFNRRDWTRTKLFDFEWIVGKNKHSLDFKIPLGTHEIVLDWWDGDRYPVSLFIEQRTWRNRIRTMRQTCIDMDVVRELGQIAPPFPGKGENSWDCGDDGLYGASVRIEEAPTIDKACEHFAAMVVKSRLRHGSRNWRPRVEASA